jgi:hypothetical protein
MSWPKSSCAPASARPVRPGDDGHGRSCSREPGRDNARFPRRERRSREALDQGGRRPHRLRVRPALRALLLARASRGGRDAREDERAVGAHALERERRGARGRAGRDGDVPDRLSRAGRDRDAADRHRARRACRR